AESAGGPAGGFEFSLPARPRPRNWLPPAPDATTLMVRETFWDKPRERRAELAIERLGGAPPEPLAPAFVVSALARSLRFVRQSSRLFFDLADQWRARPHTFFLGDPPPQASTLPRPHPS